MSDMMIRFIIFDLDGTLVESSDNDNELVNVRTSDVSRTLRVSGEEAIRIIKELRERGANNYELYETLLLNDGIYIGGDLLRKNIIEVYRGSKPQPDLSEGLRALQLEGIKLILVTNSPDEIIEKKLEDAGICAGVFSRIIGWEEHKGMPKDTKNGKALFLSIITESLASPSEFIGVGDEPKVDLVPLKELGAYTILICGQRFTSREDMSHVDIVVDKACNLVPAIRAIQKRVAIPSYRDGCKVKR